MPVVNQPNVKGYRSNQLFMGYPSQNHGASPSIIDHDVKNITLQIKNITCFFTFIKTLKKHAERTVSVQIRSTVSMNQIKSIIMLQNTRSDQEMESLPMRNASYL